ncbi:MAG: helix-turn-helix transcriptional regulator [Lachnospiraceae bacterium]|jgi:AraC-like DNA-binding protein|nr:helix-turn-helix transcriptional regulator [Lachnospiraceae bacterium]
MAAEISRQVIENRYNHIYIMNEALFGQSFEQLKEMMAEMGLSLKVDFSHFYICRTGISKKWYRSRLGMTREHYIRQKDILKECLENLLEDCGYVGEMDTVNYDRSKQLAIVFSPGRQERCTPREVAEKITVLWEETYKKKEGFTGSGLANVTAFAGPFHSYEELEGGFEEVSRLHRLDFFRMESMVLDRAWYEQRTSPCDFGQIKELLNDWEQAFFTKQYEKMEAVLRQLFCVRLKNSFDRDLCERTLTEFRDRFAYFSETFDYEPDRQLDSLLSLERYASIEELFDSVNRLSRSQREEIPSRIHSLSRLSMKAVRFIRDNYEREIGLTDLAEALNVAPGYISRIFNREVGVRIPSYLTRIRIEKARQLLSETDLRVSEVARRVGIENVQYFNVLFKKHVNMSPQEYRKLENGGAPMDISYRKLR